MLDTSCPGCAPHPIPDMGTPHEDSSLWTDVSDGGVSFDGHHKWEQWEFYRQPPVIPDGEKRPRGKAIPGRVLPERIFRPAKASGPNQEEINVMISFGQTEEDRVYMVRGPDERKKKRGGSNISYRLDKRKRKRSNPRASSPPLEHSDTEQDNMSVLGDVITVQVEGESDVPVKKQKRDWHEKRDDKRKIARMTTEIALLKSERDDLQTATKLARNEEKLLKKDVEKWESKYWKSEESKIKLGERMQSALSHHNNAIEKLN